MFQFNIQRTFLALAVCVSIAPLALGQENAVEGTSTKSGPVVNQDAAKIVDRYAPLSGKPGAHPDFILPSIDDDSMIQLSSFRGKKVLLLHFASW